MNILTSIRSFLEKDFGSFFCDFEAFYLVDPFPSEIDFEHYKKYPILKDDLNEWIQFRVDLPQTPKHGL